MIYYRDSRRGVQAAAGKAPSARLAILAVGVLMAAGCNRQATVEMPQRPPPPVTVTEAVVQDVPVYLDEIGKTTAREYVNVEPQVTGQVEKINFEDGAETRKGDLLFTIDPRLFDAALAQAEANVGQQRAALDLAKEEFGRVQSLIGTKAISQQDFDQKKNAVAVSEAQVQAGEAAVRTAKLNLDYCTIRSPIDGRVGQRQVDVGNIVKANETSLVVVQRLNPIYADFTTNERNLEALRKHMADGTLKTQVWVPGEAGAKPRDGDLTFLDTAVQPGAGTIKLRATMENSDRRFWGGQFVNVRLVLQTKKDAVLVPATAIQIAQAGPYVYVVNKESVAKKCDIVQGQRQGDLVVIDKGVGAGDRVIVTGQMTVAPDAKVTVLPPLPPQPSVTGVAKS